MSYKYNPLLVGKLDLVGAGASRLSELDDVNTAGTVNGKVLTFQSGTWLPETVAGGGDMLISQYVTGAGTVYNASRLEGETLATVQAHNVAASKVTTGTFGLARIPSITNAYLAGEITSDKIPALSGTALAYPLDADSVGTTQIEAAGVGNDELAASGLDISKFTVGTAGAAQIPSLPTARITSGTFGIARIPTMDDAHIPDLDTLSYSGAFAEAQIPNLPTTKITTGTFGLARIPGTLTGKDADKVDGADAGVAANTVFKIPAGIAQGDIFNVNSGGSVVNLPAGTTGHFLKTLGAGTNPAWESVPGGGDMLKNVYDTGDNGIVDNSERLETNTLATVQAHNVAAAKITSGTFALARIPSVDDARIPDLETLSYGGSFAEGQIPNLPTTKITTGTFGLARIPSITNAYLAGEITSDKIPALSGTALAYPLDADSVGTTQIEAAGVGNDELAASGLDISKFTVGTAGAAQIPSLPTARITSGTFGIARIPTMDDAHIPDLETLSYGAAFATAQVPAIGAYKIASGTLAVARHETLDNLNGTVALAQIPTMDDAHIPDLDTLSYGAAFATAQIPAVGAYKTASGTLNADRIPVLPTARYGSAVLVSGTRSMTNSFRLKSNAGTTGMATVDGAIFFDTTADKVKVYVA